MKKCIKHLIYYYILVKVYQKSIKNIICHVQIYNKKIMMSTFSLSLVDFISRVPFLTDQIKSLLSEVGKCKKWQNRKTVFYSWIWHLKYVVKILS